MRNALRATRLVSSFSLGLFALLAAAPAFAQEDNRVRADNGDGMDTHLFRPAIDSKGFFTVNGSEALGAGNFMFGLVSDYGHNLMRLEDASHGSAALVTHSFQGTFLFNYGVTNPLVVGLAIPVDLLGGDDLTQIGPTGGTYASSKITAQSFGFLGLHAKYRLTKVEHGFGIALIGQVGFFGPETARMNLGGDSMFVWPHVVLEKRFGSTGQLKIGLDVGYRLHTQKNPKFDQISGGPHFENANLVTGGAGIAYRILEPVDLVAETYATQETGGAADPSVKLSDEVVGGIKVFVERNSYLMLGAGVRATNGFEAADQRGFIGFIFEPSIGDRDGDGIPDDVDQCPDQPEDFDGFEDEDGCPDPDNDKDGVPDVDDNCPNIPGPASNHGCPLPPPSDRDGDGVPDAQDKCPDEPGPTSNGGCPLPKPADRDGDGIPDDMDQCPDEPGPKNNNGCPPQSNVIVQDNNILILQKVMFKTGSAEILPESNAILNAVATTIKQHPEFTMLEVQGHADERSGEQYNLNLTRARAAAVVEAVVAKGVTRDRVRSMGFGFYCPIDPAHNQAAWEKNRRVEFKVVKTQDGPTGVELGCDRARAKGVVSPP